MRATLAATDPPARPGAVPPWLGDPMARGLARFVDHTLLRADATEAEIRAVAHEGRALGVASVCVNGRWVRTVARALEGSPVRTCAVVGFPLGAMASGPKVGEAQQALAEGAHEVDMVQSLGDARAGAWAAVAADISAVRRATEGAVLKVILETALLNDEEVVAASLVAQEAGADFVKTSTGFSAAGGATEQAVRLMRRSVGAQLGVKASGGIRTAAAALAMLAAGASRLGMSSTSALGALVGPEAPTLAEMGW